MNAVEQETGSAPGAPGKLLAIGIAAALAMGAGVARADELSDLKQRLDAQEQQIKVLERKLELNDEAAKAATASTGTVKASPKGLSIQSPDNATSTTSRRRPRTPGRFAASARRSKARSTASTILDSRRTSPADALSFSTRISRPA
jgi:hypothetical protein